MLTVCEATPAQLGIIGFGRFGMLVLRAASANPNVKVNAVNDPFRASRLHHQPTPVRQCPPAVQRLVKLLLREHNVLDPNGTSEDVAGRRG